MARSKEDRVLIFDTTLRDGEQCPGATMTFEEKARIAEIVAGHSAALLENHGPIVCGASLDAAVFAIEELEEAAKLAIITHGMRVRHLTPPMITDLNVTFRLR